MSSVSTAIFYHKFAPASHKLQIKVKILSLKNGGIQEILKFFCIIILRALEYHRQIYCSSIVMRFRGFSFAYTFDQTKVYRQYLIKYLNITSENKCHF